MNTIEQLLHRIERNEETIVQDIAQLNDLIRSNDSLRKTGMPGMFYSVMKRQLSHLLAIEVDLKRWGPLEVFIKCMRNSGAAFKTDINNEELDICALLGNFVDQLLGSSSDELPVDSQSINCLIYTLQYFFNLSQGNQFKLNTISFRE